jgi:hypothetical protein
VTRSAVFFLQTWRFVPGSHLDAWEEVKRGERAAFIVRPAVGQSVDVGAAYRVEVKPGNQ